MITLLKSVTETNILIVDDTPDNLRLLARILEAEGYMVRKSLSGRMALQGVYRDPPDLILLDINMPDISGYAVCQELKASESTAHIPIIFISALNQINDKVRAFEIGGQDYIAKPFQELEILMRVKNQLLIQQQRQQLLIQNQRLEQEIKERLKAEAEVRQLSLTDELTGLYNRRGFFVLAEHQLKAAWRSQMPCCLVFIDLDGLKVVNDTLGHAVGDRMITHAAQLLKQTFRDADIVGRLGGDEFAVFIPACPDHAADVSHRLETNLCNFNQTCEPAEQVSMSIGISQCNLGDRFSLTQLIAQADQLMYEHKRAKYSIRH
ncbi:MULTISPECIES: diguanylate cyclase [unclassified Leptolyngbya]|uniref:GGDEF domain-containing response regulator n=1 Tax=unclassified Leptolyngbya TaxID=2650499 RepID=UPI00168919DD|nr:MULTISPECIES: diguanylate cyclase [unclassified Leptolyngbya]MBD1913971.1 diguanylate cyclase [Leptolyngbya sp. FACHB-8]MBD2155938.1 diguanylate cyclase [Leptolyngbya sp. FACHB-16]